MAIAPFHPAPAPVRRPPRRDGEKRRTRLALIAAAVGIAAALTAYAISPGVRHAVGHAEHSVRHAVSNIFDHDAAKGSSDDAKHAKHAIARATKAKIKKTLGHQTAAATPKGAGAGHSRDHTRVHSGG